MAVVCLYTMWHPRDKINLMLVLPIEMRFLLMLYVVYELHPVLLQLAGSPQRTGIGHAAHLGGLAFGFVYWQQGWRIEKIWNRFEKRLGRSDSGNRGSTSGQRFANSAGPTPAATAASSKNSTVESASKPPVVRQAEQKLESDVDAILEKITREGSESLSAQERKVLERASKKYREDRQ